MLPAMTQSVVGPSSNWQKAFAVCVAGFTLLVGVVTAVIRLSAGLVPELGIMAWLMTAPVFGFLLVVRAGAVRMGWLLLLMALGGALAAAGTAVPSSPESKELAWLIPVSAVGWFTWLMLNLVALPLLFPTGRPPTRRWRPVLWTMTLLIGVAAFLGLFTPELEAYCSDSDPTAADCATWEASGQAMAVSNCDTEEGVRECDVTVENPLGIAWVPHAESSTVGGLTYFGILVLAVLALVSMGFRLRRAASVERQQIKFLFVALGFFVLWTIIEAILVDSLGVEIPAGIENVVEFVSWTAIPVSIYLAITRYRLYEIDRLISRTVTYTVVVGLLAGGVALVSILVSTRFEDPIVVAATTLGVAALFSPLQRRVQSLVDRRFNRSRYDAERVMNGFAASLRDEVDSDSVVTGWEGVVVETMHPASVGVWVRSGG